MSLRVTYDVTVQPEGHDVLEVQPSSIDCSTLDEALHAARLCLERVPDCVVMIGNQLTAEPELPNDPDLDDWPAPRHMHCRGARR